MPEFYSTQDVADRLGVSIFTIRRYIQSGKLEAVKLEGGYRIHRAALDAFLAARSTAAAPAEPASVQPPADAAGDLAPPARAAVTAE